MAPHEAGSSAEVSAPALVVAGLTKRFGGRAAVDGLSFELPRGAFLTVLGPNGAGKTTLVRMLALLSRPSAGSIGIGGVDALEHPDDVRGRIGMISHATMLYPDLTALENLVFYGQLYGVPDPQARALELLDAVGLKHRRLDRVRTFSRGMAQRASIARALMNDPALVLLDEPYAGLDAHAMRIFESLIERVRDGRTFVMVSHDLERASAMATHLLVMSRGRAVRFAERVDMPEPELRQLHADTVGGGVA